MASLADKWMLVWSISYLSTELKLPEFWRVMIIIIIINLNVQLQKEQAQESEFGK